MLQAAYKPIGGLKVNGLESKENMIQKIPFWKLEVKNGEILSVRLYKDKNGRKSVAGATNGTREGVKSYARIANEDLNRSYSEISKRVIPLVKKLPNFKNKVFTFEQAQEILDDEIRKPPADDPEVLAHPELANYFYQRKLQGKWETKLLVGEIGHKIVESIKIIESITNKKVVLI